MLFDLPTEDSLVWLDRVPGAAPSCKGTRPFRRTAGNCLHKAASLQVCPTNLYKEKATGLGYAQT